MSTDSGADGKVGMLLRRLVALHTPDADVERVLKESARLLDSAMSTAPSLQGLDPTVQAILTRLVRDGKHNVAMRLARLAAMLKSDPTIDNQTLWALLYTMSALRGSGAGGGVGSSTAATAITTPSQLHSDLDTSAFDGAEVDSDLNRERTTTAVAMLPAESAAHSAKFEQTLVRDLLLIIQGEDGNHITLSGMPGEERVSFARGIQKRLSGPMKVISSAIAELGFLFRLIRRRVTEVESGNHGLVQHNFASAVQREMDDYYKSIMAMRSAAGDGLTLRMLYRWAEEEKEKLRVLARLCDELRPLRGGQILAHLRVYRASYLAPEIDTMLSKLFARSAASLSRMLEQWLCMGVIEDPHNEFFIMVDPKVAAATLAKSSSDIGDMTDSSAGGPNAASSASHRIWWGLYKVRSAMLPAARHRRLADKALIAGKSVAFLRRCCGDSIWVEGFHSPAIMQLVPRQDANQDSKEMLGFDGLDKLVEKAEESASQRLMELFYGKFNLSHHFAAIKRYLLLSQGDFTQSLIDSLSGVLDSDGEVMLNSVTGLVDAALRSASSFRPSTDADILERLNVKILVREEGVRRVGWDVFSLTYRVEDAPVNTVFSAKVMNAYLSIFRFLWKLKRMDHLVNKAYVMFSAHQLAGNNARVWSSDTARGKLLHSLRKAHFVRLKMSHLVQNVEYYCTFEVLEGNWNVLERDMAAASTLSELIEAHAKYLVAIKDRTMLSDRCRAVLSALDASLDVIPEFFKTGERLCEKLENSKNLVPPPRQNTINRLEAIKERTRRLAAAANTAEDAPPDRGADYMALVEIEHRFDVALKRFLHELREHTVQDDTCLFLAFRLNFNQYFGTPSDDDNLQVTTIQ